VFRRGVVVKKRAEGCGAEAAAHAAGGGALPGAGAPGREPLTEKQFGFGAGVLSYDGALTPWSVRL